MVKFAKQLELQLVPEWRDKFCDYRQLKKEVRRVKQQQQQRPAAAAWRGQSFIKIHQREAAMVEGAAGSLMSYETELLEPLARDDAHEKAFFKKLDEELNKVNHFFVDKEREFIQRGEVLNRQLCYLTDIQLQTQTQLPSSLMIRSHDNEPVTHCYEDARYHDRVKAASPFSFRAFVQTLVPTSTSCLPQGKERGGDELSEDNSRRPFNQGITRNLSMDSSTDQSDCDYSGHEISTKYKTTVVLGDNQGIAASLQDCEQEYSSVKEACVALNLHAADDAEKSSHIETVTAGMGSTPHDGGGEQLEELHAISIGDEGITGGDAAIAAASTASAKSSTLLNLISRRLTWGRNSARTGPSKLMTRMDGTNVLGVSAVIIPSASSVSMKHAKKMLRIAFVEFYRGLGLLRTFSSLNMVAFAKILKKYDKVTGRQASYPYLKIVEKAHFSTSHKTIKMMDEVERIFIEHFAKSDEKKAMMLLRPIQHKAPHTITFFLGLFSGCSLALLTAFVIILHLQGVRTNASKEGDESYLQLTYQVFGMVFLLLLHLYIYGLNVYSWRRARINYAFIFEFAPKSELRHREILLVCTGLSTVILVAMLSHLIMAYSMSAYLNADVVPLITILLLLLLLICPLNVCYRSTRVFLMSCLKRIVLSPFYKVVLADFFLADQLTSQVAALRFLQFIMCYYFGGYFQKHDMGACNSNEFHFLAYLISFLPYWWRLMQCLRRWADEGDSAHISNGGKYLSAMAAAAARISYSYHPTSPWLVVFVITSSFATLYQMYWDVVRDWGLFQPNSRNPWLRDQLVLKRKSIYYSSIALNLVLRFAWLQQVVHWQIQNLDRCGTDLFFAALEVIRRGHWNFYRLENEHLNNVGKYRAVKLVPLPFHDAYETHG